MSLETSITFVKLIRQRGGNVHISWFIPFKTYVIDSLPLASCVAGVELFFNFVFILSFSGFDGVFPDLKADVCADKADRTSLIKSTVFGWGRCGLFLSVLGPLYTS